MSKVVVFEPMEEPKVYKNFNEIVSDHNSPSSMKVRFKEGTYAYDSGDLEHPWCYYLDDSTEWFFMNAVDVHFDVLPEHRLLALLLT